MTDPRKTDPHRTDPRKTDPHRTDPPSGPLALTYPVHFVCPAPRLWPEITPEGRIAPLPPAALAARSVDGLDCWVTRSFYEFTLAGLPVTISPRTRADAINVVGARFFGRRDRGIEDFVLIPRADAHDPKLGNVVLHQTPAGGPNWVHHWIQPGIVPRDPARGARVERLSYKGAANHIDRAFLAPDFLARLEATGVSFDAADPQGPGSDWADYSACDVTLAVRNLTRYAARNKPASKLVNAWYGEVPALLGPEPAYRALRKGPLDYIEVASPADILAALARLRTEPQLYADMVETGRQRRTEITDAGTLADWVALLNGPVAAAFERWQATPRALKALRVLGMALAEPRSKRHHQRHFNSGPRVLGGPGGPGGRAVAGPGRTG